MSASDSKPASLASEHTAVAGDEAASADALLRQRAQANMWSNAAMSPDDIAALTPGATLHLLHELQVHQIELAMQNEQLRESQVALDAMRERYFDLYDLAPVGYCTIGEQGLIRQANLAAASLFGMPRGALLKQTISRRILAADQDIYYLHRKQLLASEQAQTFELRMVKDDGATFWAQMTATVALDAAGAREVRAVLGDITERKKVEAEHAQLQQVLLEKNAELERTRLVAEKASQAKSDFLSSMSHELRTPLHAILGFGQLMEMASPPPTAAHRKSVEQILKAGWHLLKLVNEVLDVAGIESGKQELLTESVDLGDMLGECEAMVEPVAQQRGIALRFAAGPSGQLVLGNRTWIKQVLINLLSNAIKYNRVDGSVAVHCVAQPAARMRIFVENTGAGLTPDRLANLFQAFNRLGQEASGEEGTGLGLFVCKRLVELMGGAIGAESTPGAVSVFWIELNLAVAGEAPDGAGTPLPEAAIPPRAPGRAGRSMLYVEDNAANLMLVEAIVARHEDIRLYTAPSAMLGIALARQHQPDMILMDIAMPEVSGIEALHMLAQDPATMHIPVVAISANAMPEDIKKGLEAGFVRYITKPIKFDEFEQLLDQFL